jgi:ABC-type lipoprotein release transport system permease subunit
MYKIILAIRYLIKRRITYFAVLAVALCVFIVVVVMTVLTGLVSDFKQKNHQFTGDCVIGTKSLVGFAYYEDFMEVLANPPSRGDVAASVFAKATPDRSTESAEDFVEGISPVIKSFALITRKGSQLSYGVEIMGIDPVKHSQATSFGQTLHYHKDDVSNVFEPVKDPNFMGCVLGVDLALERDEQGRYTYGFSPADADIAIAVTCFPLTAKGALAKAGTDLVNTQTFYYSDTSQSGLARVDSSIVYLPFEQAQLLCGMAGSAKRANAIYIKFKPNVKLNAGCEKVALLWQKFKQEKSSETQANLLDTVTVQSWKSYRRAVIAPMEQEQTMMTVMFGLVGITTIFIVFVVFYMIISHKSKDIGILKSIGVANINIVQLFLGFAFLVGFLGSAIGAVGGWRFLVHINQIEDWLFEHFGFQLWDRTIYVIGDIPNQVEFKVLMAIIFSAIFACLVGALIPTWQAARLKPVETLQVSQL